ncbi:MAG: 3-oxoacyl-[acyl-carrier-protein] reductase [Anaerolineales bacterium]|nr:3-oxoacyl-[acyl-carrier-protein] reductase [Anaerolineales bacterium]
MNLEGKIAIVTGGRRGIGRAIAEVLARQGADIVLGDRDEEEALAAAEQVAAASGRRVHGCFVDVADHNSAVSMVDCALSNFGRVDILVNNAGVTRDTLIVRMSEEDWDSVIDVNLKGAWNCAKAVVRPMMKQRWGRIVNISSVSGLAGQAGQTNYSASKAGLIGFTKALAREVASRGITVNAVAPGFVPTALTENLPKELVEGMMKLIPMGRWGSPEEIAHAVAFLASQEASYITGQVLSIDGGMMMM